VLMKNPSSNPLPYSPATELERQLCDYIARISGKVVLNVQTWRAYPATGGNELPAKTFEGFSAHTGRLTNGRFSAGRRYSIRVNESGFEVVTESGWI
jgi:hypothetical protein